MTYRRTWFSGVLWFLYSILCIMLLEISGEVVMQSFTEFSGNKLIAFSLLAIPAAAALYWIIRCASIQIRKKHILQERNIRLWGCIAFLLIMAVGVVIRVICLIKQVSLAEVDSIVNAGGVEFYDMAVVTEEDLVPILDYGISDLYVTLLFTILSFLGNRVTSAVYLQFFLQIIAMVLVYAVTRKIAGRLPACAALMYFACSFSCLRMLVCFGPEWLFFIFYMFGMLMTVSFVKSFCENRLKKPLALIGAVVIGVLIGGLAYLDLTAFSLLFVIVAVAVGKRPRHMIMPVRNSGGISAAVILTTIFMCAAAWLGAMGVLSFVKGTGLSNEIMDRFRLFYQNSILFTNAEPYFLDIYLIGMLIVPASFLVFEFFRKGHEQNYSLWILLCLLVAPTPMAVYGEHGFGVLSMYVWAVLAGLGLQNCLFGGRAKVMQAMIEEINKAAEIAEASEQAEEIEGESGQAEEIEGESGQAEEIEEESEQAEEIEEESEQAEEFVSAVQITEGQNTGMETAVQEQETEYKSEDTEMIVETQETAENQVPKPRYIENPLPLPKKHVAKEMDYQYDIAESDMKYDVEVSENDDFDV